MLKSVGLTGLLIQRVTESILPAESLNYASLSYKPLSTLESRVLASPAHSYIWTQIPPSLSGLRGFISNLLREHGFGPPIPSTLAQMWAQNISSATSFQMQRNMLQMQSPHRSFGGGLLGNFGVFNIIFGRRS